MAPPQQPYMIAPPQQPYMIAMPPPDYDEIMRGSAPLPAPVSQKPLVGLPGLEFGAEPVQLNCWSCHRQVIIEN